jgi:hypothetical protein
MGKFETINVEGIKTYTLFSKNSIGKVLSLDRLMPKYSFYSEGRDVSIEIYLDSPNNLLTSAGIILSKVFEEGKAYFRVEREEYLAGKKTIIPKEKKVFIHPIGLKDSVVDHTLFLIDGITSMFSTKFHIDLENVLKTIVPKLQIENKKNYFKIFSGKGFKANMIFEDILIKNYETKRKAEIFMLKIEQTSSKINLDEFDDFTSQMEKYCKEILPINESKYEMAKRATKAIAKK